MALPKSLEKKYLDEEALFKQYYGGTWGKAATLKKLQGWWTNGHGINPNTGKPFSCEGMSQAMWRWALENLDEAKKIYEKFLLIYGYPLTDEHWKMTITKKAFVCMKGASWKFYRDHPEYAPVEEK